MPNRILIACLAVCGVIALWPSTVWLSAALLDRVDDRYLDTIAMTGSMLPLALALAAITLVVHGLRLNAAFREQAAADIESYLASQVATEVAEAEQPTGRMAKTARVAPKGRSGKDRATRRAKAIARRKLRQSARYFG